MPIESEFAVLPDGHVLIRPRGDLDLHTVDTLSDLLECGAQLSAHLVIDLGEVPFMDSSALTVLVQAHQRAARRGGGLTLIGPARSVRRLLVITETEGLWPIYGSAEEAAEVLTRV